MNDVFVGRQPILEKDNALYGYELLFRSNGAARSADVSDNISATANVMTHTLNTIGLKTLIGDRLGFVNVDLATIQSGVLDLLPPESTVLELLETEKITGEVVDACRSMRKQGYAIALDDFVYDDSYLPILDVADYVKVDVMQQNRCDLAAVTEVLHKHRAKLLAEKVETREDFEYCRDLGFTYFQGYFFAKPLLIAAKSISPSQMALIDLSNALAKEPDYPIVEEFFRKNPELNFKLLRFMNSASFYTTQKITSIRHALALLGYRNLRKWITLLLFSHDTEDMKSNPLLGLAVIRGRVMELFTKRITGDTHAADSSFICGVLSLIDVLFGTSMEAILPELSLSQEICNALEGRQGLMGRLLLALERMEATDLDTIPDILDPLGITLSDLYRTEAEAIVEYESCGEGKP